MSLLLTGDGLNYPLFEKHRTLVMRGRAGGVGMYVDGSHYRKNSAGNNNVEEIVAVQYD